MRSSVAKFCAKNKQHFAREPQDIQRMADESIVHVVARAINWHMKRLELTESALGKKAKVSPRTVGNFLRPEKREVSASGKVPSGKLTELEMIAAALGVSFVDLVQDQTPEAREQQVRVQMAMQLLAGHTPVAKPGDSSGEGGRQQAGRSRPGKLAA